MRKPWEYSLLLVLLISACSPSEDAILTAIEQTQAKWTPVPTQTPFPTYTPYPTPTTAPTPTETPPPASSEMIRVPAGEFLMGCDPWDSRSPCLDGESPSHIVYLDDFSIDLTEVTNTQYAQCVMLEACRPPEFDESGFHLFRYENPEYADYPITNINWYDARDYCAWVGKRLPREAEWEKAARGWEDERFYPWGDKAPDCSLLNFAGLNGDCPDATTPVGDYPRGASPYGALDMAGNVREWVADWYDANFYLNSPAENPHGPESGWEKVLRGGSYSGDWIDVRVNRRSHNPPTFRGFDIGFRCARDK
jgi:formylglycine-generating enzyme required for sulfatase activity